jgi:hypothetical protein
MLATIREDAPVRAAAERMADLGIDTLVVLDGSGEPVGFVTDRDLVVRCIARGLAVGETEVRAIMTSPVPPDLVLPILERADVGPNDRNGTPIHVLRGATYETLPSLLAIDDALTMVRLEMARQSGGALADGVHSDDAPPPAQPRRRPTAPPPS